MINDLYQELIIDHGTNPRNFYILPNANAFSEGYNPLCGDKIQLYLMIEGNQIQKISFQGKGCAISTASASLLTEVVSGKTLQEAIGLFECFQNHLLNHSPLSNDLAKLQALSGVRTFPARVKCATLAWHILESAFNIYTQSK